MAQDPTTKEPQAFPGEQPQDGTGLETGMRTKPDHGEQSYVGRGALKGKVALITGGDSGIGRAVAIAYAREGADIALSFLAAEAEDAAETARWVEQAGRRVVLLPGDLADPAWCRELVARTVGELGRIDVLVNNAAAQTTNETIADIRDEDVANGFAVNVFATLALTQAAAAHMQPGSSVINTGSVQAKVATKSMLIYAATKGAISTLTVGLSNLLASDGIRVNCVAPGPIWTPIQPISKSAEQLAELGTNTPLGRAGQPAELAGAYVLLASEEGSYMAGAVLAVTGGMPMT